MTGNSVALALWLDVIGLYAAEDPLQIAHTQAVTDYTGRIAELEELEPRRVCLLKTAALLHDVGCPAARALTGRSLPPDQEREGAKIARELLAKHGGFSAEEADWIASAVGAHHRIGMARELHFEPLFEADLIVNLLEGYYDRAQAEFYRDKMVRTAAGRRIFDLVFGLGGEGGGK